MPMPQPNKQLKQKPSTAYRGKRLRRETPAQVARAAEITPTEIEKLKADFIRALNDWMNRHARSGA